MTFRPTTIDVHGQRFMVWREGPFPADDFAQVVVTWGPAGRADESPLETVFIVVPGPRPQERSFALEAAAEVFERETSSYLSLVGVRYLTDGS